VEVVNEIYKFYLQTNDWKWDYKNTVLQSVTGELVKRLRRRDNGVEGTLQNNSVTSGEGIPHVK